MDLKNTKVTELNITESKFRNSVLRSGIGKVSAELKNSSAEFDKAVKASIRPSLTELTFKNKNQYLGVSAEYNVQRLLESEGWTLIFHRLKTKVSEIDLIFEKENKIILVEVKKLTEKWRVFQRITPRQQLKLKANQLLFHLNFKDVEVRAYVAWVDQNNKISFCSLE